MNQSFKIMKKLVLISLLFSLTLTAQDALRQLEDVEIVFVKGYWGNLEAVGYQGDQVNLQITHTEASKRPVQVDPTQNSELISVHRNGTTLTIEAREPRGFESIDLKLSVPQEMKLMVEWIKGGEVNIHNFTNGIEINHLNGSVKATRIGSYAFINAANGSIQAHFNHVDKKLPISLVTMNGGIDVQLPGAVKRDVRLISRKNGYVITDFDLKTERPISNLNIRDYSKKPILANAKINGGGSLLFLSTENGPISILKH